jgi:hypothetical protein
LLIDDFKRLGDGKRRAELGFNCVYRLKKLEHALVEHMLGAPGVFLSEMQV